MLEALKAALDAVATSHHRLVILLGDFGAGKTALLKQLAEDLPAEYVNLNLVLSDELLTRPQRIYADVVEVHQVIDEICDARSSDGRTLLVDNVELLFSPELGRFNPVDTFKRMARQRSVILALPARHDGSYAEYSTLGRADHMRMSLEGYPVFDLS